MVTTADLFGVSKEVAKALKLMPHDEYLSIGIALMTRVQKLKVNSYQSEEFQYRAKAIANYEKWLKEE